jgi:hypothetical protein
MHYKNGRPVALGDWVIGKSHNSHGGVICGIVQEMMPQQGPCNIRIHVWKAEYYTEEGHPVTVPPEKSKGGDDYGDAKEFIRADDGLRMISAIVGHGNWDGPYL